MLALRQVVHKHNTERDSVRINYSDKTQYVYSAVRDYPVVLNIDRACAPLRRDKRLVGQES